MGRVLRVLAGVATAALLVAPASASAFGPLSSFGAIGIGSGQLTEPRGIEVTPDGSVHVGEASTRRVSSFTAAGAFLRAFGKNVAISGGFDICTTDCHQSTSTDEAGGILSPDDVAVDAQGRIFVADRLTNRIDAYSPGGEFLYAFGKAVNTSDGSGVCTTASGCTTGSVVATAGSVFNPRGIAIDAAGHVYVTDSGSNRIDVFTSAGEFLYGIGKEVNFSDNSDVCTAASTCRAGHVGGAAGEFMGLQEITIGAGGDILVVDTGNRRVAVYSAQGAFLRAFGKGVSSGGDVCTALTGCSAGVDDPVAGALNTPRAIAADGAGNVYVTELDNHRVSEFTEAGSFVRAFGEGVDTGAAEFQVCTASSGCLAGINGTVPGATPEPYGVAVDCRGAVYVAEESTSTFARIERFAEPGTALPPCPPAEPGPGAKPSNQFKFGKLKLNRKKGTATLSVSVPGPGTLTLRGKGLKKAVRKAKAAGRVTLPVVPVGKAKKKLRESEQAKFNVKVTFVPTGGEALSKDNPVKMKWDLATGKK